MFKKIIREDVGSVVTKLRIITGLILFLYVFMHLLNHSFNLISIEAAEIVRQEYFSVIWQNPIGIIMLYFSLIVHMLLGFYAIMIKKSFKLELKDWTQIIFPVLALIMLLQHVAVSFIITKIFPGEETYPLVFAAIHATPDEFLLNTLLFTFMTIFIWFHGVIGIDSYIKHKATQNKRFLFYLQFSTSFKIFYWVLPIISVLGFLVGLKEMSFIAYIKSIENIENFLFSVLKEYIPQDAFPFVFQVKPIVMNYYPIFILIIIVIILFNIIKAKFFGTIEVKYPGGKSVFVSKGTSILEASKIGNIPHQAICGGRGRCTTCRIKISSFKDNLTEPNTNEIRAIQRVGLDEGIRLACQLKPNNDITVIPLLNPNSTVKSFKNTLNLSGKEKETVILFVDLRDFTKLSEKVLPYDVVYILNKYYSVCGEVIESNGGRLDKFIGDGIMAIFDTTSNINTNSKNALLSANKISSRMKQLNEDLFLEFSEKIKFGIGVHAGNTIVGMMGYGNNISETVVGDNVNIASRLEGLSKKFKCELIVSKYVADNAKVNTTKLKSKKVLIRGRKESLEIFTFAKGSELIF